MANSPLSHLTRRGDVYYFRRAIPVQLTALIRRSEWKISLRTRDRDTARLRCREYSNAFDQFMGVVKQMPSIDATDINRLLRGLFEDLLSESEAAVFEIREDSTLDVLSEVEGADTMKAEHQSDIANSNFSSVTKSTADELLAHEGATRKDVGVEGFEELCRGILRAKAEQMRITSAMLRGAFDEAKPADPLFEGLASQGLPPLPGEVISTKNDTVRNAIDNYLEIGSSEKWTKKTADENRNVLGWFLEQIGKNRKLREVGANDVKAFRSLISKLPKNASKRAEYKGMTVVQMVKANSEDAKLSAGTQQKYFGVIKAFLADCEDEHGVDMSAALRVKRIKKISNKYDARHPFSTDQLSTIFQSPQYTGHSSPSRRSTPGKLVIKDGKFWLPLLALMTGARMGELIQLTTDDVRQEGDVYYLDINKGEDKTDGKSLKSASSERKVPIHQELINIGLLSFANKKKETKALRLFEEIKPGKNGSWSHNASKYMGRFFKNLEIKTSKHTFHSFRHNFADALRLAQVEDSHIKALMGHEDATVTSTYGSQVPLKVLATDMDKVIFDVALDHLHT